MSEETEDLKRKLDEILTSGDKEWVNSVTVTLDAMYRQFELEQHSEKTGAPFCSYGTKRQISILCRKRSQDRFGCNVTEPGFILLIL